MGNRNYLPLTLYGTASIGDTIRALRSHNSLLYAEFNFCGLVPSGPVKSYRGYYDHVAIEWVDPRMSVNPYRSTVGDLLSTLEAAIGRRHEGYKGGLYLCANDTPLWVSRWGETSDTGIRYIEEVGDRVIIGTGMVSYD